MAINQQTKRTLGKIAMVMGVVALVACCFAASPVAAVAAVVLNYACVLGCAALVTKAGYHFFDGEIRDGVLDLLGAVTFGLGPGTMTLGKAFIGA